jgi:hypothetical protein
MNGAFHDTVEARRALSGETGQAYLQLLRFLEYTLHELPTGVLYGTDSADIADCQQLMAETYRLESLATALGIDLSDFITACRWHYEHYAHYLGRHRHFGNYARYMAQREAPETHHASPRWIGDPSRYDGRTGDDDRHAP